MNVKEQMQEDLNAIFTTDENAVTLRINDVEMVVIDLRTGGKRAGSEYGNYAMHQANTKTRTLHIRETDMPTAPVPESIMYIGDEAWTVKETDYAMGEHIVRLEINV